ncbi:class I SAM-dependent methyltransferase [Hellea sp.]|nr:class I SAM-dependent methyltransferase [Hellea sp.]
MIEGKPSRTALMTAVQRAHHYQTAPEPKVLRDSLAMALTGLEGPEAVQGYIDTLVQTFASFSDLETATLFMNRVDGAVCMRSRVVEEELPAARERGLKQLVILGAGLDSTAYRCTDLIEGLEVFEVDHPSTQAWKREQLKKANIAVPDNLSFVPFDFENQTLAQALEAGGVSADKVTFFTWLGVHMYLTNEAVKSTFSVMGAYPKGSEMVMDYISPSYVTAAGMVENSVEQLQEVVSKMGEPLKSKYYESELEEMLTSAGFSAVNFLSARWLIDNYLGGKKDAFDMPDEATSILTAVI